MSPEAPMMLPEARRAALVCISKNMACFIVNRHAFTDSPAIANFAICTRVARLMTPSTIVYLILWQHSPVKLP